MICAISSSDSVPVVFTEIDCSRPVAMSRAEAFTESSHTNPANDVGMIGEVIERQVTQFLSLVELAGELGDARMHNAGGREVVGGRRMPLRYRQTRGRLIVRVHTHRALGSEHGVAICLRVFARGVVMTRDVCHCRRCSQLERACDATV